MSESSSRTTDAVTAADIRAAAARIAPFIVHTPLLRAGPLDARTGGRLLVKAESLQRTGSFKMRGATNKLLTLDAAQRRRGVVAFSSGNHAKAVAEAAAALGIAATVVMPADAPRAKLDGARRRGAEVILYDREREDREAIVARIVAERGPTLVRPFDDPVIVAGAGTCGLEAAGQAKALAPDAEVDLAVIPCGGGGLSAGCAVALRETYPNIEIVVAEPAGFDDTTRSLASGEVARNARASGSICDALLSPTPGLVTLPILRAVGARGVTVSDAEVTGAMRFAFEEFKLVLEPGGAAALAAALSGRIDPRDRTAIVVCSGGNVDADAYAAILAA